MKYLFCGDIVTIKGNNVYRDGRWIGHLFVDEHGVKHVLGPLNKGILNPVELMYSITINGVTYEPQITDNLSCESCDFTDSDGNHLSYCGNICNTFECALKVSNIIMKRR